jgi:uncharacterized protein YqeY
VKNKTLEEQIMADLKKAMKQSQKDRLRVLRSLKSALLEKEISQREGGKAELSDEQTLEVLMKAAKQRKDSIEQFKEGGRDDLVQKEEAELAIINSYLPKMLTEEEIRDVAKEKIEQLDAGSMADM